MGHVSKDDESRPGIKGAGTCWRITLANNAITYVESDAFEDQYYSPEFYGEELLGEWCHSFLDLSDNLLGNWDDIHFTGMTQVDILNLRRTVWIPTTGLGGPHQTSELPSSVKSTSIRLIFGRIDCSRRVLEARLKSLVQTVEYAHIEVGLKLWNPHR